MTVQRFCTACGKQLSPGHRFCPACGATIVGAVAATPLPAEEVAGQPPAENLPVETETVATAHVPIRAPAPAMVPPPPAAIPASTRTGEAKPGTGARRLGWYVGLPLAGLLGAFGGLLLVGGDDGVEPAIVLPLARDQQDSGPGPTRTAVPSAVGSAPAGSATSPGGNPPSSPPASAAATNLPTAAAATAAATAVPPTATTAAAPTQAPTATTAPAAPNLLTQGGFESGPLSAPWGTGIYEPNVGGIFWGSANATAQVSTGNVRSGTYALRIVNSSAAASNVYRTLSRKVDVTGGAQYCFTVWVRTENGSAGMLTFRFNNSWSQALGIGAGTAAWSQYAYTFAAEDSNIDVRMVSENTGTAWIDDLELTLGACKVPNGRITSGSPR